MKNKVPCAPFPHCKTYGILQGASPFPYISIALTLILFGLFCLSPSILFAQELKIGPTTQNSDLGLALQSEGLKHAGNAGNVIAVLEVTVTGDVGTANEARTELPEELFVQGSYPNPFRTATSIVYNLPEPAQVYAEVFDMLGRVVYTSPSENMNAGWGHSLSLDLSTTSSGLYVYRVNAETASGILTRTGRMIQIR